MGIVYYVSANHKPTEEVEQSPTPTPSPIASPMSEEKIVVPSPVSIIASPPPGFAFNPQASAQASPQVNLTQGCIVTIDNVNYEISKLRVSHSGGDIFKCGNDMSKLFWKKHDQRILDMMQQYKI